MIEPINITTQNNPKNKAYFSVPITMLPEGERNYCLFNQNKVNFIASQKKFALPYLKQILQTSQDEKEIVETLYIIDRICDKDTKGIPAMYPVLAKFNDTKSANIQVFLAGIYRKTQVPDAFGPLVSMLIKNANKEQEIVNSKREIEGDFASQNRPKLSFDPNEEIGGAVLEYIRNYSNNPKQIDYTA